MLALGLMLTIAVTSAFANDVEITSKVLAAFKKEFSTAQEVKWSTGNNYFRADFKFNDQNIFAYYTQDGELDFVARYMSALQLPIIRLTELKNDYSQYWVTDLVEVNNSLGTHYYITLEDAETTIKLVSTNGAKWESQSKKRKI